MKSPKQEYKGYTIEIIRGKREALVIAILAGCQISARGKNAKVALEEVKNKIDGNG